MCCKPIVCNVPPVPLLERPCFPVVPVMHEPNFQKVVARDGARTAGSLRRLLKYKLLHK